MISRFGLSLYARRFLSEGRVTIEQIYHSQNGIIFPTFKLNILCKISIIMEGIKHKVQSTIFWVKKK